MAAAYISTIHNHFNLSEAPLAKLIPTTLDPIRHSNIGNGLRRDASSIPTSTSKHSIL